MATVKHKSQDPMSQHEGKELVPGAYEERIATRV